MPQPQQGLDSSLGWRPYSSLPDQIAGYQVLQKLGAGGMCEVLLGQRSGPRGFSRAVAIKRLHADLAADPQTLSMFIDEARIASRMCHENIAQIVDFGESDGVFHIVMEHVEGWSLETLLAHLPRRRLPPPLAAHVVAKICAALDHAHRMTDDEGRPLEVIHRDVKPSNVLIGVDGQVKLIDFGVAKAARRLTRTVGAALKGSYAYMSPEQATNRPLDHRSDLFAVGTLLYEALAGVNPFFANSALAIIERVRWVRCGHPERLAGVDVPLAAICRRAMARDPDQRYRSAGALRDALCRYSREELAKPHDALRALLARSPLPQPVGSDTAATIVDRPEHADIALEPTIEIDQQMLGAMPTLPGVRRGPTEQGSVPAATLHDQRTVLLDLRAPAPALPRARRKVEIVGLTAALAMLASSACVLLWLL